MQHIHFYLSLWISLIRPPKVITKTVEVEVEVEKIVKDPNGFIKNDMILIRSLMKKKPYKIGDSIESVAYRQAQEDLLALIESKIIGRG